MNLVDVRVMPLEQDQEDRRGREHPKGRVVDCAAFGRRRDDPKVGQHSARRNDDERSPDLSSQARMLPIGRGDRARRTSERILVQPLTLCAHAPADLTARERGGSRSLVCRHLDFAWCASDLASRLDLQMAAMSSFEPSTRRDSRNGVGSTQGVSFATSCAAR